MATNSVPCGCLRLAQQRLASATALAVPPPLTPRRRQQGGVRTIGSSAGAALETLFLCLAIIIIAKLDGAKPMEARETTTPSHDGLKDMDYPTAHGESRRMMPLVGKRLSSAPIFPSSSSSTDCDVPFPIDPSLLNNTTPSRLQRRHQLEHLAGLLRHCRWPSRTTPPPKSTFLATRHATPAQFGFLQLEANTTRRSAPRLAYPTKVYRFIGKGFITWRVNLVVAHIVAFGISVSQGKKLENLISRYLIKNNVFEAGLPSLILGLTHTDYTWSIGLDDNALWFVSAWSAGESSLTYPAIIQQLALPDLVDGQLAYLLPKQSIFSESGGSAGAERDPKPSTSTGCDEDGLMTRSTASDWSTSSDSSSESGRSTASDRHAEATGQVVTEAQNDRVMVNSLARSLRLELAYFIDSLLDPPQLDGFLGGIESQYLSSSPSKLNSSLYNFLGKDFSSMKRPMKETRSAKVGSKLWNVFSTAQTSVQEQQENANSQLVRALKEVILSILSGDLSTFCEGLRAEVVDPLRNYVGSYINSTFPSHLHNGLEFLIKPGLAYLSGIAEDYITLEMEGATKLVPKVFAYFSPDMGESVVARRQWGSLAQLTETASANESELLGLNLHLWGPSQTKQLYLAILQNVLRRRVYLPEAKSFSLNDRTGCFRQIVQLMQEQTSPEAEPVETDAVLTLRNRKLMDKLLEWEEINSCIVARARQDRSADACRWWEVRMVNEAKRDDEPNRRVLAFGESKVLIELNLNDESRRALDKVIRRKYTTKTYESTQRDTGAEATIRRAKGSFFSEKILRPLLQYAKMGGVFLRFVKQFFLVALKAVYRIVVRRFKRWWRGTQFATFRWRNGEIQLKIESRRAFSKRYYHVAVQPLHLIDLFETKTCSLRDGSPEVPQQLGFSLTLRTSELPVESFKAEAPVEALQLFLRLPSRVEIQPLMTERRYNITFREARDLLVSMVAERKGRKLERTEATWPAFLSGLRLEQALRSDGKRFARRAQRAIDEGLFVLRDAGEVGQETDTLAIIDGRWVLTNTSLLRPDNSDVFYKALNADQLRGLEFVSRVQEEVEKVNSPALRGGLRDAVLLDLRRYLVAFPGRAREYVRSGTITDDALKSAFLRVKNEISRPLPDGAPDDHDFKIAQGELELLKAYLDGGRQEVPDTRTLGKVVDIVDLPIGTLVRNVETGILGSWEGLGEQMEFQVKAPSDREVSKSVKLPELPESFEDADQIVERVKQYVTWIVEMRALNEWTLREEKGSRHLNLNAREMTPGMEKVIDDGDGGWFIKWSAELDGALRSAEIGTEVFIAQYKDIVVPCGGGQGRHVCRGELSESRQVLVGDQARTVTDSVAGALFAYAASLHQERLVTSTEKAYRKEREDERARIALSNALRWECISVDPHKVAIAVQKLNAEDIPYKPRLLRRMTRWFWRTFSRRQQAMLGDEIRFGCNISEREKSNIRNLFPADEQSIRIAKDRMKWQIQERSDNLSFTQPPKMSTQQEREILRARRDKELLRLRTPSEEPVRQARLHSFLKRTRLMMYWKKRLCEQPDQHIRNFIALLSTERDDGAALTGDGAAAMGDGRTERGGCVASLLIDVAAGYLTRRTFELQGLKNKENTRRLKAMHRLSKEVLKGVDAVTLLELQLAAKRKSVRVQKVKHQLRQTLFPVYIGLYGMKGIEQNTQQFQFTERQFSNLIEKAVRGFEVWETSHQFNSEASILEQALQYFCPFRVGVPVKASEDISYDASLRLVAGYRYYGKTPGTLEMNEMAFNKKAAALLLVTQLSAYDPKFLRQALEHLKNDELWRRTGDRISVLLSRQSYYYRKSSTDRPLSLHCDVLKSLHEGLTSLGIDGATSLEEIFQQDAVNRLMEEPNFQAFLQRLPPPVLPESVMPETPCAVFPRGDRATFVLMSGDVFEGVTANGALLDGERKLGMLITDDFSGLNIDVDKARGAFDVEIVGNNSASPRRRFELASECGQIYTLCAQKIATEALEALLHQQPVNWTELQEGVQEAPSDLEVEEIRRKVEQAFQTPTSIGENDVVKIAGRDGQEYAVEEVLPNGAFELKLRQSDGTLADESFIHVDLLLRSKGMDFGDLVRLENLPTIYELLGHDGAEYHLKEVFGGDILKTRERLYPAWYQARGSIRGLLDIGHRAFVSVEGKKGVFELLGSVGESIHLKSAYSHSVLKEEKITWSIRSDRDRRWLEKEMSPLSEQLLDYLTLVSFVQSAQSLELLQAAGRVLWRLSSRDRRDDIRSFIMNAAKIYDEPDNARRNYEYLRKEAVALIEDAELWTYNRQRAMLQQLSEVIRQVLTTMWTVREEAFETLATIVKPNVTHNLMLSQPPHRPNLFIYEGVIGRVLQDWKQGRLRQSLSGTLQERILSSGISEEANRQNAADFVGWCFDGRSDDLGESCLRLYLEHQVRGDAHITDLRARFSDSPDGGAATIAIATHALYGVLGDIRRRKLTCREDTSGTERQDASGSQSPRSPEGSRRRRLPPCERVSEQKDAIRQVVRHSFPDLSSHQIALGVLTEAIVEAVGEVYPFSEGQPPPAGFKQLDTLRKVIENVDVSFIGIVEKFKSKFMSLGRAVKVGVKDELERLSLYKERLALYLRRTFQSQLKVAATTRPSFVQLDAGSASPSGDDVDSPFVGSASGDERDEPLSAVNSTERKQKEGDSFTALTGWLTSRLRSWRGVGIREGRVRQGIPPSSPGYNFLQKEGIIKMLNMVAGHGGSVLSWGSSVMKGSINAQRKVILGALASAFDNYGGVACGLLMPFFRDMVDVIFSLLENILWLMTEEGSADAETNNRASLREQVQILVWANVKYGLQNVSWYFRQAENREQTANAVRKTLKQIKYFLFSDDSIERWWELYKQSTDSWFGKKRAKQLRGILSIAFVALSETGYDAFLSVEDNANSWAAGMGDSTDGTAESLGFEEVVAPSGEEPSFEIFRRATLSIKKVLHDELFNSSPTLEELVKEGTGAFLDALSQRFKGVRQHELWQVFEALTGTHLRTRIQLLLRDIFDDVCVKVEGLIPELAKEPEKYVHFAVNDDGSGIDFQPPGVMSHVRDLFLGGVNTATSVGRSVLRVFGGGGAEAAATPKSSTDR